MLLSSASSAAAAALLALSSLPLSALVQAHAAPPNPDQLFALQASAAAAAAATASASHEPVVRRHLRQNAAMQHGGSMQRVRVRRTQRLSKQEEVRERERKRGLDSSEVNADAQPEDKEESDLEARGDPQIPLAPASQSSAAVRKIIASAAAAAPSASASAAPVQVQQTSNNMGDYFTGVSSYYLYALADSERYQVLDAIKSGGFKVVRIFVAYVGQNNKGSNNAQVNDLEPGAVGTYDDTVLLKIDQLMADCKQRGLKLLIALSDRYALGYWSTDAYALQLNIVKPGSSGVQRVADASAFYTSSWAATAFDKRLQHALQHRNALLGGRTWAELDDVVYAYEPQNEPQGHMAQASGTWACDRAAYLKSLIKSNILVGSGGGITIQESLGGWATTCASFDIISVHDYGTSASTAVNAIQQAKNGPAKGKVVMMGEWGMTGANKANVISSFVNAFKTAGIPWMYWEVVKPGKASSDFEVWTDEPSWGALTGGKFDSSPQYVPGTTTTKAVVAPAATTKAQTQWSESKAAWSSKAQAPASVAPAAVSAKQNTWTPPSPSSPAAQPKPTPSAPAVNSAPKEQAPSPAASSHPAAAKSRPIKADSKDDSSN